LGKSGTNIHHYKTYPRIVGKLEEKISSLLLLNPKQVLLELCVVHLNSRSKCSAASRSYVKVYGQIKEQIITDVKSMKMGSPEDFSNFITAVFTKVHLIN
jgi:1-pyrroline-5-carboxylate dehydrogenase